MIDNAQPSILPAPPVLARYLSFDVSPGASAADIKAALQTLPVDERLTVGIGEPLVSCCGAVIEGLRTFPALSGPGVYAPSIQHGLWCWLRGDDRGELLLRANAICSALEGLLELREVVDGFKHGDQPLGRDLTGYEDGTENPTGEAAEQAALVGADRPGLAGSSFVAVQKWVHDLHGFAGMTTTEQDHAIGRRKSDNEELEDAPESAHVKRTEQESFSPPAFVLRRSMPFSETENAGLQFVAFGCSLEAFEVQLRRMLGLEDGIVDALFQFSRPVSGGYYWCPPVSNGHLDLSMLEAR